MAHDDKENHPHVEVCLKPMFDAIIDEMAASESGHEHRKPAHVFEYKSGGVICRTHQGLCQMQTKGRDDDPGH